MRSYKYGLAFASLLCFTLAPMLYASVWNQKEKISFNEPIQVPGVVLPAGTYTFQLLGVPGARNIVEIFHNGQLDATVLTVADKRLHPTGKTVLKLAKVSSDQPDVLKAWFYPGAVYGHEFVYPHDEAVNLAKAHNVTIYATKSDLTPYLKESFTSDQTSDAQKMENAPVTEVQPSGEETDVPPAS